VAPRCGHGFTQLQTVATVRLLSECNAACETNRSNGPILAAAAAVRLPIMTAAVAAACRDAAFEVKSACVTWRDGLVR
jgi:hypothetical protein